MAAVLARRANRNGASIFAAGSGTPLDDFSEVLGSGWCRWFEDALCCCRWALYKHASPSIRWVVDR
eukprot:scaffold7310_cov116-Isochrysis_galbana.AAC.10